MIENPDARREYVRLQALHAGLHWMCANAESLPPVDTTSDAARPEVPVPVALSLSTPLPRRRFLRYLAAAAVFLAVAGPAVWWTTPQTLATITRINGIGADVEGWQPGNTLAAGPVSLPSGLAEITFTGGTTLLLEGPADLDVQGRQHVVLRSGRAVVHVPPADLGFVVETARARILDLGTEFGVSADDETVQVFDGEVAAQWKTAGEVSPQQHGGTGSPPGATAPEPVPCPNRFIRLCPAAAGSGDIHPTG